MSTWSTPQEGRESPRAGLSGPGEKHLPYAPSFRMCRDDRANPIRRREAVYLLLTPLSMCCQADFLLISFLLIGERRRPCLGIMHRTNAPRRLLPTAAIGTGIKMANQAIQHIDDSLRKHHASALFTLTHCLLQCQEPLGSTRSIFAARIKSLSVSPLIL